MSRFAISSAAALATALLLARCATVAVDPNAVRRVIGTEEGIRIEAEITGDTLSPGSRIPITWSLTNDRATAVAVADILAETSYDPDSQVVTVGLGAEVPGEQLLPRLVAIGPGETKTFTAAGAVRFLPVGKALPKELRLRVNFLNDVKPFERLVGIEQKALADRAFAAEIFGLWVEKTEAVFTGAVPVRWGPAQAEPISAAREQ